MVCARCASRMFTSHVLEVESIDDIRLETDVFINECPACTAVVKVIMPRMPGTQHSQEFQL